MGKNKKKSKKSSGKTEVTHSSSNEGHKGAKNKVNKTLPKESERRGSLKQETSGRLPVGLIQQKTERDRSSNRAEKDKRSAGAEQAEWSDAKSSKPSQQKEKKPKASDSFETFEQYLSALAQKPRPISRNVREQQGDLFDMPAEYALGHCVAEDLNMGSGIAVAFRQKFKRVGELLNQKARTGGLAVLKHNERFIYYLVTKSFSSGKPTYKTLFASLEKLRAHIVENKVEKLALPQIGCGLDRLDWNDVKFMLEFMFKNVDVEIVVCSLGMVEGTVSKHRNLKVVDESYPIEQIDPGTIILYLSTEDGHVSSEMQALDAKFHFLREFNYARKKVGDVIYYEKNPNYMLCGCIVKRTKTDSLDFEALETSLYALQKKNNKCKFEYLGMQAFRDQRDPMAVFQVINLLRNSLRAMDIHICWSGDLRDDLSRKSQRFFSPQRKPTTQDWSRSNNPQGTDPRPRYQDSGDNWRGPNSKRTA